MATRKGNSKDYWEDREAQEVRAFGEINGIIQREQSVMAQEKKIYASAVAELDKELEALKEDVGEDAVTRAALQKPMSAKDLEQWSIRQQSRLDELIAQYGDEEGRKIFGMENARTGKQDRANRVVRRQETLRKSINAIANGAAAKTETVTQQALEKEAEKGAEAFQNQIPPELKAEARADFDTVDEGTVTRAAQTLFKPEDFSERIWANRDVLVQDLERSVGLAVTNGWSIPRLAKEFEHNVAVDERSAERIARTEMNRVSNAAELAQYRENNIKFYRFIATEDARTCPICGNLHDTVHATEDATPGENFPPVHPNCRCRTVISTVDENGKEDTSWLDDMQSEVDDLQSEFDAMDEEDEEAERKAEEARKAEELQKAEEARKAEEAKKAEKAKKPAKSDIVEEANKEVMRKEAKRLFSENYEIKDDNGNILWSGTPDKLAFMCHEYEISKDECRAKGVDVNQPVELKFSDINGNEIAGSTEAAKTVLKIRDDMKWFIKDYVIENGLYNEESNSPYHFTAKDLKTLGIPSKTASMIKECDFWLSQDSDNDLIETAKEYRKRKEEVSDENRHNAKTSNITADHTVEIKNWDEERELIKYQLEENTEKYGAEDTRTKTLKRILNGECGSIPNYKLAYEVAELQHDAERIIGQQIEITFVDDDELPGEFSPSEDDSQNKTLRITLSRSAKPSVIHHEMTHAIQYFNDKRILGNEKGKKYDKNWREYVSNHPNRTAGKRVWKSLTSVYSVSDYLPGKKADKALMEELFDGKSWSELTSDERSIMHAFREIHASISGLESLKYGHSKTEYGDLNIEAIASVKEILSFGNQKANRILDERYSALLNIVKNEWRME